MEDITLIQELVDTAGIWLVILGAAAAMWKSTSTITKNQESILRELLEIRSSLRELGKVTSAEHIALDKGQTVIQQQHEEQNKTIVAISKDIENALDRIKENK